MPPLDQSAAELRSQARAESIENRAKMLSSMKKALSVAYDATGTRMLNKAVTQSDLDALAAAKASNSTSTELRSAVSIKACPLASRARRATRSHSCTPRRTLTLLICCRDWFSLNTTHPHPPRRQAPGRILDCQRDGVRRRLLAARFYAEGEKLPPRQIPP